jgi:hypothetical protein
MKPKVQRHCHSPQPKQGADKNAPGFEARRIPVMIWGKPVLAGRLFLRASCFELLDIQ